MKTRDTSFVRASISFPSEIYQNLQNLAKQKKVSLAWVVREAAERYVSDETAVAGESRKKGNPAQSKGTRSATD
jgi:predicted DNA-binding protein